MKHSAVDAARWVEQGRAPSVPSTSRVTPMWRALREATDKGFVVRDGFGWSLTAKGREALAGETAEGRVPLDTHCHDGLRCIKEHGSCICICPGCKRR